MEPRRLVFLGEAGNVGGVSLSRHSGPEKMLLGLKEKETCN